MLGWRLLWKAEALFLAVLVGCSSTPRVARMEGGAGGETLVHIPHTTTTEPVEVPPEEVTEALRRLAREVHLTGSPRAAAERALRLDAHFGNYLLLRRDGKLVPLEGGTALEGWMTEEEQAWVSWYKAWCRSAHGFEGDCLGGALVGGKYLDLQGRYMWAMALSKAPVLEEFEKALGDMVSMQAVMQAALWTVATLLVLLAIPEPVTKFVAAWATVALILWVGAKTLYNLITGWFELMEEVKVATTFEELREAGEKFGRLFSREAAQAFACAVARGLHDSRSFSPGRACGWRTRRTSCPSRGTGGLTRSDTIKSFTSACGVRSETAAPSRRAGRGCCPRWMSSPGRSPHLAQN